MAIGSRPLLTEGDAVWVEMSRRWGYQASRREGVTKVLFVDLQSAWGGRRDGAEANPAKDLARDLENKDICCVLRKK